MDDADRAQAQQERLIEKAIEAARGNIPPGTAGECETCGEESIRLVSGMCARCRDRMEGRR